LDKFARTKHVRFKPDLCERSVGSVLSHAATAALSLPVTPPGFRTARQNLFFLVLPEEPVTVAVAICYKIFPNGTSAIALSPRFPARKSRLIRYSKPHFARKSLLPKF
jgi:hypothetical protein